MTIETMNLTVFDPIMATLVKLEAQDKSLVFDHTTPEGEKDLRSWVYRVRSGRSDLEKARVAAKAEALAYGKKVDSLAKELKAPFDKIITERMKPLDEIEAKKRADAEAIIEAERVAKEKAEQERIADLERREAETARKEAEFKEKERLEREKNIAAEAAEKARKDAIAKAEREKAEAIEAEKEKARRMERDRIAKEEAEKAEKERLAKIEADRIANKEHREEIEHCIGEQLNGFIGNTAITNHIMDALKAGRIRNVTINY